MPSSHYITITPSLRHIISLRPSPQRILDVGVGFGKWGMLLRELFDIQSLRYNKKDWGVTIDGVEIFESYLLDHQRYFYDSIITTDIRKFRYDYYDIVVFGDILEHVTKEDAFFLIRYAQEHSRCVLITTPFGFQEQGECLDNPHEQHLCGFTEDDFSTLGFSTEVIEDSVNNYTMLLAIWKGDATKELLRTQNFHRWKGAYANGYNSTMGNHAEQFYKKQLDEMGYFDRVKQSRRIAEYAPANGEFAADFITKMPAKQFFLVDISTKNLESLQNRFKDHDNVAYILDDNGHIPLADIETSFSFLLSQCMPQSLWQEHLTEVRETLAENGSYYFQFGYNSNLPSNDSIDNALAGNQTYSPEAIEQALRTAGFSKHTFSSPISLKEKFNLDTTWYFCKATR